MKEVVKMQFGSHVYGCNVEDSDIDIKCIYLPTPKELLMTKAQKVINRHTSEVDFEAFPLREFIQDAMNGQTYALDMLFTPIQFVNNGSKIWYDISVNRNKLLSQNVKPMVGYAKAQAMKYSLKGTRLAVVRDLINFFGERNSTMKLEQAIDWLSGPFFNEHYKIVKIQGPNGLEKHVDIIGKFFPLTASCGYVTDKLLTIEGKYGGRAQEAELNKGLDYKALYHAVRVGDEAYELLTSGLITFPRPNADVLLKIRNKELDFVQISNLIEANYKRIEAATLVTKLPEKANKEFWDDYVYRTYLHECKMELN